MTRIDPLARLEPVVGARRVAAARRAFDGLRDRLDGRRVRHVSQSTDRGGVAELLTAALPCFRSAGVLTAWSPLRQTAEFRRVVKGLYYRLTGVDTRNPALTSGERRVYESVCRDNAERLIAGSDRRELVILHDHQTLGMAPYLAAAGRTVVWRVHISPVAAEPSQRRAWRSLRRYASGVDAVITSTPEPLCLAELAAGQLVVPPSIDPFAVKNRRPRSGGDRDRRLRALGLPDLADAPLVTQVSRWDRTKNIPGVMRAFADHVDADLGAHLALAGPDTRGDAEGARVYEDCLRRWRGLADGARARVHLLRLRGGSSGASVNMLQHMSTVVVQCSLSEGFGLTVTEALWKSRPVVGSRVSGIASQIQHGRTGTLVADPRDAEAAGAEISRMLAAPDWARTLGKNAREHVWRRFLPDVHLGTAAAALSTLID